MIVTYDREDARRRITIILAGAFDLTSALAVITYLAADGGWSYGTLYDTRNLATAPTMAELQTMVDRVQVIVATKPAGPTAVVAPEPAVYEMAMVYAQRLEGKINIAIFRSLDEARQWLDGLAAEGVT